jgi:hypothetical protein
MKTDRTVDFEPDVFAIINAYADEHGIPFDDAVAILLKDGITLIENDPKEMEAFVKALRGKPN